ncbi:MAG: hypothetical protein QM758_07355 [Armatimonas sp.]
MRNRFIVEEESTTRVPVTTPEQEKSQQAAKAPRKEIEKTEKKAKSAGKPATSARQSPGKGRMLRGGILFFSGLGLFALIVPPLTGLPLSEWLQGANFKAAYSGANLSYMSGTAALKLGNLAGTTDALLKLSPESTEAEDLAVALFPRLLDAGDYTRALQVCTHMLPEPLLKGMVFPNPSSTEYSNMIAQSRIGPTVSLTALGKSMAEKLGPKEALARIASTPELNAQRELLIPTLFSAITSQTVTVVNANNIAVGARPVNGNIELLKGLVPTLSGMSQTAAIKSLVTLYMQDQKLGPAWEWALKLPVDQREGQQSGMMQQLAVKEPKLALELLETLGTGAQADAIRMSAMWGIVNALPTEAPRLLESIKTPLQRDMALNNMILAPGIKEKIPLLNQITSPGQKMETLISLMKATTAPEELQPLLLLLTEVAHQNPTLVARHDSALKELAAQTKARTEQEGYLNLMLDPKAKAAAQQLLKDGKLTPAPVGGGGAIMRPAPPR